MAGELGYARETIVKAYNELKDNGIINSKRGVGYFINNTDVDQKISVAVLMYSFHDFQQSFYNTFRENVGENVNVDVFFHHNNPKIYESILKDLNGQYGMYVIAPIHNIDIKPYLSSVTSKRIIIVDRYEYFGDDFSYVSQEFEDSSFRVFRLLAEAFQKFSSLILFFDADQDHPPGVLLAFKKFSKDYNLNGKVHPKYTSDLLQKGTAYITIGDHDLWALLKDCNEQQLELGTDVGILSSNDTPVKEFVMGGISTYYSDFDEIARCAAEYVKGQEMIQKIMPVKLKRRKSL